MTITLTPEHEALCATLVASGRFPSVGEVLAEALRSLEAREELRTRQRTAFGDELQRRLDSLDRGEGIPAEEIEAYLRERSARHRQQAA